MTRRPWLDIASELLAALGGVLALVASSTSGLDTWPQIAIEVTLITFAFKAGYWRRQAWTTELVLMRVCDLDRRHPVVAGVVLPPDDYPLS